MLDIITIAVVPIIALLLWLFNASSIFYGSVLVAGVAAILARLSAREQVRVAERKIFLDLLDRRISWYSETRQIVKRYYDFINSDIDEAKLGRNGFEYGAWFNSLEEQKLSAQWLFGIDVEMTLRELEEVTNGFAVARKNLVKTVNDTYLNSIDVENGQPVQAAYCESYNAYVKLSKKFNEIVKYYIYVGDIKHSAKQFTPRYRLKKIGPFGKTNS